MAYKQIRRRMKQEVAENEGAAPEVNHAPDLSQIQTDRDLMTADDAMALQDLVGNRATGKIMGATPLSSPLNQGGKRGVGYVQPKPLPAPMLRRESSPHVPAYAHVMRKLELQRASWDGSFETNDNFESKVNQQSGGGQPLPSDVRADLEPKFGADFSEVRVHADGQAAQLSQDVGAQAFTHGSDIYFNEGKYNPESGSGKHLLAHELTHTVQQGGSGVQRDVIQRNVTDIAWNTATDAKPSALGVKGGVFFITVNGTKHVVKATENVGATKFAEQLVTMLGGPNIETSDSIPVPQTDNEFGAIMQAIQQLTPPQPRQNDFNTQQEFQEATQKYQAYITKRDIFQHSPYLMIQQNLFTPGTEILGVEDLTIALHEAGGNKGALQGRVDTDVQTQVNMLTNQTKMKSVGRLLAIDTLFGNQDRFEQMNVQNAFMRADDTIGAIDTEAIMQSLEGTTAFSKTDMGSFAVPQGGSDVERYVDFVLGSGVAISDDTTPAPSSDVMKIVTNFDRWFNTVFVLKFMFYQLDPMVKQKFTQLGFPEDGKTGFWPQVKQNVRAGLDEGLVAIQTAMAGPQYGQIKQNYQNLSQQYGSDENFGWDAFKVRGEYMSMVKGGTDPAEAKQMIVDRMTRRENLKQNVGIPAKVVRVLNFGSQKGLLNNKQVMQIKKQIQPVSANDIKNMLHVSSRAKLKQNQAVDNRLEAARVALLKRFVEAIGAGDSLPIAVSKIITRADRLRKKDVDQSSYFTTDGLLRARSDLANLGVDVDRWGPLLSEKQMKEQLGLDSKTVKNLKQRGNQRSNK